jgi:hypothetical protein
MDVSEVGEVGLRDVAVVSMVSPVSLSRVIALSDVSVAVVSTASPVPVPRVIATVSLAGVLS